MSSEVTLAYATFPDASTAAHVCEQLVRERVIACANILPPHLSVFEWAGNIQRANETGAWLKLPSAHRDALTRRFKDLHPYDVPALLFVDVNGGFTPFLDWVRAGSR